MAVGAGDGPHAAGGRRWRYRATDAAGREATGEIDAVTAAVAVSLLQARSLWVTDLEPLEPLPAPAQGQGGIGAGAVGGRSMRAGLSRWWRRWTGADLEQLGAYTRGVATLLAAGVPAERALAHAAEAGSAAYAALQARVRQGASLAGAAGAIAAFPVGFGSALAAAEASGTLAATFERLATHLEERARVQQAIRTALVYPALLAVATTLGTLVILVVVVPRFTALLGDTGVPLPWATRLLVGAGEGVVRVGWLLAVVMGAAVVGARAVLQAPAGRRWLHTARLEWPVVGPFERAQEAARYLDTLALGLGAGVPLLTAMALGRGTLRNVALAEAFGRSEAAVRDGAPFAESLPPALPVLARRLLAAGEAAGALGTLAQRAAEAAQQSAHQQLARVVALIEPALILGFGGLVGLVALALLQAIYGVNSSML